MLVRASLAAVTVVLALTAGCGGGDEEEGPERLSGPVVVTRSGGIAGIRTRLVIRPDGTGTLQRGRGLVDPDAAPTDPIEVPAPQLRALERALVGWRDVDPRQGPDPRVADAITTVVDYDGHQVTSGDGTDPDDDLAAVLLAVSAIGPRG